MDANTIELLTECSSGCHMAMDSVKKMRQYAEDPELNHLLENYGEKHRRLEGKIADLLEKYGERESAPDRMVAMMAGMEMHAKMFMHPDDKQVARIMMDGCNMGIQSVSGYLNRYSHASTESRKLAEELICIEEEFARTMRRFV